MPEDDPISLRRKLTALREVAEYRPSLTLFIALFSVGAATLEAVGLGFILPIIEIVRSTGDPTANATGALGVFVSVYEFLNIPFTLATVVGGVMSVLTIRYISSFLVSWLQAALRSKYVRHLQEIAFTRALSARTQYYDEEGSDDILNAIVTQTNYAGQSISGIIRVSELVLMTLVYAGIAFFISPVLTLATAVLLGGITYLLRSVIEPGAKLGSTVADANEKRQQAAQAGTQGIRDIRIFGLADELRDDFIEAIDRFTDAQITLRRNESALSEFYDLAVAVTVFGLIFVALQVANLSLSELGVFLFAMFRLGPKVSNLNSAVYNIENKIPHLVRTQDFIDKLTDYAEPASGSTETPANIRTLEFQDVTFGYNSSETSEKSRRWILSLGEISWQLSDSNHSYSAIHSDIISRLQIVMRHEPILIVCVKSRKSTNFSMSYQTDTKPNWVRMVFDSLVDKSNASRLPGRYWLMPIF